METIYNAPLPLSNERENVQTVQTFLALQDKMGKLSQNAFS